MGDALDGSERRVDLERLGEALHAFIAAIADSVVAHAASQGRAKVSAAADTFQIRQVWEGSAPQRRQRLVDLQCIAQLDYAFGRVGAFAKVVEATELIAAETANRGVQKSVSGC